MRYADRGAGVAADAKPVDDVSFVIADGDRVAVPLNGAGVGYALVHRYVGERRLTLRKLRQPEVAGLHSVDEEVPLSVVAAELVVLDRRIHVPLRRPFRFGKDEQVAGARVRRADVGHGEVSGRWIDGAITRLLGRILERRHRLRRAVTILQDPKRHQVRDEDVAGFIDA